MKHQKRLDTGGDVEMNMTPMIDVTFLLIIFFMVVTELSRLEVDQNVRLPHIDMSVLDREPDPGRLVLNVDRSGNIRAFGRIQAHIDGVEVPVLGVAPQLEFVGLDQINILVPRTLLGAGLVEVQLTVDGIRTNVVTVRIG